MKDAFTLYVPEKKEFLFICEGTGDNLLPEDIQNGYVDYIELYTYSFTGDTDAPLQDEDGGEMMLKSFYQDFENEKCLFEACLDYMYDDKTLTYIEVETK